MDYNKDLHMDCNKDLTMESDFIGMFNPVRGLQNNKGSQGSGGAVDHADIAEAVNNYFEEHPVSDPTDIDFSDIEGV